MTGTHSLHHIFKPCRRTHRPSREDTHENYFYCCSLFTGPYVYGLWAERISQLHPPAAPGESAGDAVLCCRQRIALCRVLFRDAGSWRIAAALRLLRATGVDSVGGGALQHPCVSLDACAGDHCSGLGGLCTVGAGLPSVPRKLQGHLQREACDAVLNCVAGFVSARLRSTDGKARLQEPVLFCRSPERSRRGSRRVPRHHPQPLVILRQLTLRNAKDPNEGSMHLVEAPATTSHLHRIAPSYMTAKWR